MSTPNHVLHRTFVRNQLEKWSPVANDPTATLGEVFELIERALGQTVPFYDVPVCLVIDDLREPLASWFQLWGDPDSNDELQESLSYWQGNLEEDLQHIGELVEELGPGFRFGDL